MSSIAIITARGGSKRIPRKNIRDFCGKPIISYSICCALESHIFDEVMVSTDSEEIAEIAKGYGANVPFLRSATNAGDYATTIDVLKEVLMQYMSIGKTYEYVCCLYPTAPFITAERLLEAYEKIREDGVDSVMTVTKFSFPPQRCQIIEKGFLKYKWPEYYSVRSQDLEDFYHDCGQFYFYRTESLLTKEKNEMLERPIIIPNLEMQDIDTEEDWKIAEMKYEKMQW